jgi:ABC-type branched-subunit amino acid transport system substrate-binding protein
VGVALADSGCETTVLLREDTPANQVVDTFVAAGLELRGQEVQRTIVVPTQTPDAAPAVQTAVSEGADCAALSINPTDIVKVITAFRQNAPDIKLAAGATAVSPATVEGLGEDAEGLLLIDQYYGLGSDRPAIQQFHSDMDTYAPEATKSFWSLKAWGGTELIIRMIEQEGANDAESLTRALNEIDSIDLGIVGAFGTTEANPTAGLERVFNTQILWFEIQDGDYVPASDGFVDIGDAMTAGG